MAQWTGNVAERNFSMVDYFNRRAEDWRPALSFDGSGKGQRMGNSASDWVRWQAEASRKLTQLLGETAKHVEVRLGHFRPGVAFDHQTPLLGAMSTALQRHEPGAVLAPYMQTGGTDARFLTDRDISVYGFVPMRFEPGGDFFDLCHGHDERVSLDNIAFAVDVTYDVVRLLNE